MVERALTAPLVFRLETAASMGQNPCFEGLFLQMRIDIPQSGVKGFDIGPPRFLEKVFVTIRV